MDLEGKLQRVYIKDGNITPDLYTIYQDSNLRTNVYETYGEVAQPILERHRDSIDYVIVSSQNPSGFHNNALVHAKLIEDFGKLGIPGHRVEAASNGLYALQVAYSLIKSGDYHNVLVVGGEFMSRVKEPSEVQRILSQVLREEEREQGATMASLLALATLGLASERGWDDKFVYNLLKTSALENAKNASLYPGQPRMFGKSFSSKMYDSAKNGIICPPLRLWDVAPQSDGTSAILLSSEESFGFEILGIGHGTQSTYVTRNPTFNVMPALIKAAKRCYAMAGIEDPRAILDHTLFSGHNPFAGALEVLGVEALGFAKQGEGQDFVQGKNRGKLIYNPLGSVMKGGHPLGGTSIRMLVENWALMTGRGEQLYYNLIDSVLSHANKQKDKIKSSKNEKRVELCIETYQANTKLPKNSPFAADYSNYFLTLVTAVGGAMANQTAILAGYRDKLGELVGEPKRPWEFQGSYEPLREWENDTIIAKTSLERPATGFEKGSQLALVAHEKSPEGKVLAQRRKKSKKDLKAGDKVTIRSSGKKVFFQ